MRNLRFIVELKKYRPLIAAAATLVTSRCLATETVSSIEGPTYAVGTTIVTDPYKATSNDPLAPFEGQSVTFVGSQTGGSSVQLGSVFLRYQYELTFSSPTTIAGLNITEAGDFTNGSEIQLSLNDTENVIQTVSLNTLNQLQTFSFTFPAITGSKFFLQQYDHSTNWTYVQNISVVPEPSSVGLLLIGGWSLLGRRRRM